MRTRWVQLLVLAAVALLIGYALGHHQETEATCRRCENPMAGADRACVCQECYRQEELAWLSLRWEADMRREEAARAGAPGQEQAPPR